MNWSELGSNPTFLFYAGIALCLLTALMLLAVCKWLFSGDQERVVIHRTDAQAPATNLRPRPSGPTSARRKSERRTGRATELLVAHANKAPVMARVVDRSQGGLGIALPCAVPINSTLRVRAAKAPERTPWVEVQVKRCRQLNDAFLVGCAYVKAPPAEALISLD